MKFETIYGITFLVILAEFIGFIFKGRFFWDAFFRGAFAIIVIAFLVLTALYIMNGGGGVTQLNH